MHVFAKTHYYSFFFFDSNFTTMYFFSLSSIMMTIWPAAGCDKAPTFLAWKTGSEPGAIAGMDLCFCVLNPFAVAKERKKFTVLIAALGMAALNS